MDPALIELNEAGPADEEVSLILRLQDGAEPPPTVRVVSRFGPIITVRCRRADILPTWASDRVISAKAPRAVHLPGPVGARRAPAEIDEAATEMEMDPEEAEAFDEAEPATRQRQLPALPVDGRGVVVGICDWGFDFTHPNFRNADGSTRLLALWDQRGTGDPRAPAPYNRGRLFTPNDINEALAQPDPCAALGYHPSSGDPNNTGSHGTHVSDIVAGNRRYPGSEVGLASGADLVFVHLGAQRLGELDNLGDSVSLLEGLDFVRRTAAAASRPCVMHLSAGKTGGPHCGVTLVERAVDILLQETPGIVLVQSGGNYADTAMHTHARVGPDQTHVIDWLIPRGDRTPNELEIWYSGMDVFDVTLVAPDGQEFSAPLAQRARLGDGVDAWGNFYHRLHEPNSGFNHVAIFLYTAAPTGRWKVVVHGRDVVDGRLHAWIERDAGSRYQSRFSRAQATSSYTTNTICNSFRAIAVGAYDATSPERPPGHFSSRGPTADGRQKPEIAAPGVRILAARSMPRDGWNGERKLVVKSGTSMAAPWVSGTVALMFQAAGRPMTIHEVRRILIGAADPHAGPRGRSSSQLGFGYLNTAAAVEAARRLGSGAAAAPPPPAVAFSLEHDEAQPDEAPIESAWIEEPLGEAAEDRPDPSFLRWAPNWRGDFPPRPAGAMGGRAFMKTVAGEGTPSDWSAREDALVAQLATGNMPSALLKWVKIELSVTRAGKTITGSVEVLPDYLSIGSDSDFIHAPLDPVSAQQVADRLDMNLATAKICHAIYLATAAANRIGMIARDYYNPDSARRSAPPRLAQDSTAAYVEHSERIQEKMAAGGIKLGTLVAGHKKDVVVSARLLKNQNKIAFHGFYDAAGYPMEPCYENKSHRPDPSCNRELPALAHLRRFSDYSQGVRLVRDIMVVDGAQRSMRDVLAHPELSWLISAEGPIDPPRIPDVPIRHARLGEPAEDVPGASRPTTVTIEAATGLGTAQTTAPIAVVSPHRQMNELLDRELILFAKARIVAEWLDSRLSTTFDEAFRDAALVAKLDLSNDRGLLGRLRPFPGFAIPDRRGQLFTTDALLKELRGPPGDAHALWPIFDVLHYHGVVLLPPNRADPFGNPGVLASITRTEARLNRARFDTQSAAIEAFARTFKTNVAAGGLARVVETGTIESSWSSAKASDDLIYRTFASSVLTLVGRLRARNAAWVAGTYRRHWWNEFSIDALIRTGRDDRGFYTRAAVRSFFEALNAACEETAAPGKFAWKAIYNDEGLAREMDGLYGAGRVLFGVDGHGPGPRMHIHLDVRPLVVTLDSTTGFRMDGNRVVLLVSPQ